MLSLMFSVTQSCLTLCDPLFVAPPGSSVHGDSPSKDTERGLPFPTPGDLPDTRTELVSLVSSALAGRCFYHCSTWEVPFAQGSALNLRPGKGFPQ